MLKKISKRKTREVKDRKAFINPLPPVDFWCLWGCMIRCDPSVPNHISAHPNGGVVDNI